MERESLLLVVIIFVFCLIIAIILWRDDKKTRKMLSAIRAEASLSNLVSLFSGEPELLSVKELELISLDSLKKYQKKLEEVYSFRIFRKANVFHIQKLTTLITEMEKIKNKENRKFMEEILYSAACKNADVIFRFITKSLEMKVFWKEDCFSKEATEAQIILEFSLGAIKYHPKKEKIINLLKRYSDSKDLGNGVKEEIIEFIQQLEE